jgi:predicted MFS family arabinose efflux permease
VTIAFVVIVVAAASWAVPPTHAARVRRPGPLAAYRLAAALAHDRIVLFVLLINFVAMVAFSQRQSFYPVFMGRIGLSTAAIGTIMSIMGLATMLSRPILPRALRWLGSIRLLALILGLIIVGLAVTPSLSAFWSLAGAISVLGFALGLLGPLSTTLITEQAPAAAWGSAISLRVMSLQFAQLIGPTVTGVIVAGFGLPAAFYFSAVVAASGLLAVGALARIGVPLAGSAAAAPKPG